MRRRTYALLATLGLGALFGAPSEAEAQTIPSPYRYIERGQAVGVFGGYLRTDRGSRGIGPASAPLVGIRYSGRFAAPVAGVVRLGLAPSERDIFARSGTADPNAPLTKVDEASALLLTADAGLRLNLTGARSWRSVAPFIEVTGGLVSVASSRTDVEGQLPENQLVSLGPAFAVNLGAGADWFLTERLSLGLSTHGLLWRLATPAGLAGREQGDNEWTRNVSVTLGGAFHF